MNGLFVLPTTVTTRHDGYPYRLGARAARQLAESALDATGWRWSRRLSLWIDALVVIEEDEA